MGWYDKISEAYPEWNEHGRAEISLWTKIRLLFKRKYVAIDWANNPNLIPTALTYKWLGEQVYILHEEIIPKSLLDEMERQAFLEHEKSRKREAERE